MKALTIYRLYFTESDCYKRGIRQTPRGVQVHSTGANNPYLKRYVQPDDGRLGVNQNGNSHNRPGGKNCASAYIGKLQDGSVAVYQALPWDYRCWLSGSGKNGNANNLGYIGFEICEDSTENEQYFDEAVRDKAVLLTAYLCQKICVTPWEVIKETPSGPAYAVMDHSELHKIGLASDHGDIGKWLKKFGYIFSDFRYWVQEALEEGVKVNYINAKGETSMDHPTLRKGDSGPDVVYLQTLLCGVGETLKADGKFGDKTEKAVKDFQILAGLTPDGVVGPKTWDALEKATNEGWGEEQPDGTEPSADSVIVSREDWDTLCRIVEKYRNVG